VYILKSLKKTLEMSWGWCPFGASRVVVQEIVKEKKLSFERPLNE
jgi:hypothetical protein